MKAVRSGIRVRTGLVAVAVAGLVGSATVVVLASGAVGAYDDGGASWAVDANHASISSSAGLVTTVTESGDIVLNQPTTFANSGNHPSSAEFDPNIAMTTGALRWSVGEHCLTSGACRATATHQVGSLVVEFSEAVRNPTLHLEGIGASAGGTVFGSTYTLDSAASDGATLGAVSSGAANLRIASSDTITTAGSAPGSDCATASTIGSPPAETAGCGSVRINGTVTQLTFAVGIASLLVSGSGTGSTTGDAVGFAVTFDQDYSDAPTSYDQDAGGHRQCAASRHRCPDVGFGRRCRQHLGPRLAHQPVREQRHRRQYRGRQCPGWRRGCPAGVAGADHGDDRLALSGDGADLGHR